MRQNKSLKQKPTSTQPLLHREGKGPGAHCVRDRNDGGAYGGALLLWHAHGDGRSEPFFGFDFKNTAMKLRQAAGDCEAEPRSLMAFGKLMFDLLEGPGNHRDGILGDTDTGIGDTENGVILIEMR